jgi:hypothetical protein
MSGGSLLADFKTPNSLEEMPSPPARIAWRDDPDYQRQLADTLAAVSRPRSLDSFGDILLAKEVAEVCRYASVETCLEHARSGWLREAVINRGEKAARPRFSKKVLARLLDGGSNG